MRLIVFYSFLLAILPTALVHPYCGVLLYSWISFMSPHRLAWGFPDTIPIAFISAIVTIVGWVTSNEPKRLRLDTTVVLLSMFALDVSLTTIWAANATAATPYWLQTMKTVFFVIVTISLTNNRVRFHALLWVMAVAIGYYGLKGGVGSLVHGGSARIFGPDNTAIANNNDIGAGLVVAIPLMNYVRINSANQWVRWGWLVVIAGSILSVAASYSRGATLGLAAIGLVFWFRSRNRLASGAVIATAFIGVLFFMPPKYFERVDTIQSYEQDESAMARVRIWNVAFKLALERPFLGAGFKATELQEVVDRFESDFSSHAVHNIYLGVMAEHGFVGFFLWAGILLVGFRNTRWLVRHARGQPGLEWAESFGKMCQISLAGYCVVGSFGNYAYWDYYFTLIGLLAAARWIVARLSSGETPRVVADLMLPSSVPQRVRTSPVSILN